MFVYAVGGVQLNHLVGPFLYLVDLKYKQNLSFVSMIYMLTGEQVAPLSLRTVADKWLEH